MSWPGSSGVDMRSSVAVFSSETASSRELYRQNARAHAGRSTRRGSAGTLALRRGLSGVCGPVLRPDLVAALEDRARADGHDRRVDVALDLRVGPDQHRAVTGDVALHLAADDHPAAADLVGDDVALLLDGHDAARADLAAGFVLLELDVLELQRLVTVLARDAQRLAPDLEGFAAIQAQDAGRVVGLGDVVLGGCRHEMRRVVPAGGSGPCTRCRPRNP